MSVEEKVRIAFETISSINKEAYRDLFLISNQVLSKNPHNNSFLDNVLSGAEASPRSSLDIIAKVLLYYVKSLIRFAAYIFKFAEFLLSGCRFRYPGKGEKLVLIDTFFLMERIVLQGVFEDPFLPGIAAVLRKKNLHYAYLPFFYRAPGKNRPFMLYRTLRKLKKEGVPVMTEYQLLTAVDVLRLLYFIILYPLHVLRSVKKIPRASLEERLAAHEMIDTLDQVTFYGFSRYLQGRRIAGLPCGAIKVISWYENQPIHKNLYKGLRTVPLKVEIYGAQLFLYSKNHLNLIPDENEAALGVVPDIIVVNGPYYIPEDTRLRYRVGPSLRYGSVFKVDAGKRERKNIVILLPYFKKDAERILRLVSEVTPFPRNIYVKAHPSMSGERMHRLVPAEATVTTEKVDSLLSGARIVIGAASGTLIEAAALGTAVISIKSDKIFDYLNPLPEYGRGIIWEEASDGRDLSAKIGRLQRNLDDEREKISAVANRYKDTFFCEASEEKINEAFEI